MNYQNEEFGKDQFKGNDMMPANAPLEQRKEKEQTIIKAYSVYRNDGLLTHHFKTEEFQEAFKKIVDSNGNNNGSYIKAVGVKNYKVPRSDYESTDLAKNNTTTDLLTWCKKLNQQ